MTEAEAAAIEDEKPLWNDLLQRAKPPLTLTLMDAVEARRNRDAGARVTLYDPKLMARVAIVFQSD
jgi:hypothetical protein